MTQVFVGIGVPDDVAATRFDDAVSETGLDVAVTIAVWFDMTEPAVAVNVALETPAKMDTAVGTVRSEELLESVTVTPPVPATWDNAAVQVDAAPELRVVGKHDTEVSVGFDTEASRLRVAVFDTPFSAAVTTAL